MTFNNIVSKIMNRLNLSSEEARTRIREMTNEGYREITSSVGMNEPRRVDTMYIMDPDIFTDLPIHDFIGYEKLTRIMAVDEDGKPLQQVHPFHYDDIAMRTQRSGRPTAYAVKTTTGASVTVLFDSTPTDIFYLQVEGYGIAEDLVEDDIPAFADSFHDMIVEYVLYHELMKLEKPQLAQLALQRYQGRLSDLRMFIAKSAYLDIQRNTCNSTYNGLVRRPRY